MSEPVQLRLDGTVSHRVPYSEAFEAFWAAYPRHVAKKLAWVAWRRRLAEGVPAEVLVRAAAHYALATADREERYVMHPATFLGPNERWRDYVTPPRERSVGERRVAAWLAATGRDADGTIDRWRTLYADIAARKERLRAELRARGRDV